MRSHFIDIEYIDIDEIKLKIEYMYVKTMKSIKYKYKKYKFIDLKNAYKILKDQKFMDFFTIWVFEVMSKITIKTTKSHTNLCIIRATFDLVFKYAIDLEVRATRLENDDCPDYLQLQCNIFKDNHWNLHKNC